MKLTLIAAMDRNRVIGRDNDIPWKLPKDQMFFRQTTMGHPIVMGRKNYESMGRPLPGRRNIVLTRNPDYRAEGCEVVASPEEALALVAADPEVFIIGGEEVYRLFLPYAHRLVLTMIDHEFGGDTFFPEVNEEEWKLISVTPGVTDERNPYRYDFHVYERISGGTRLI
ncbi:MULTISPECIES: dihydrofolate reductase [Paenibacillus]|uniref:Dihydrofolate reductase n=1 Tax=Paenibacillus residui TaxID=629724 RepID=A0ABW3D8T8_9BACL|nr:dihydrofolate reductase [Paenibacillus sp. 32O-W]